LQELAIKHILIASSCNLLAFSILFSSVILTIGLRVSSVNFPIPFSFSSVIPVALSKYSVTIFLLFSQSIPHDFNQIDEANNATYNEQVSQF